jgi:hypothetical protein
MQFCLLMSFVFLWILQMDVLVFGEDELRGFIPKNVIQHDRYGGGSVMIWGVKSVIMAKQTSSM